MSRKQRRGKDLGLWEGTACVFMTLKHDCDEAQWYRGTILIGPLPKF